MGTLIGPEDILNIDNNAIEWDEIVEIIFVNHISGNEIYYTGAYYRGEGIFWINSHGNKAEILKTSVRYGPMVKWHGNNIAEIYIPTGSPFRHSYFYDFRDNTLSPPISFPIYYDIENDYIIAVRDGGLDLYDFKNAAIRKNYDFEDNISALYLLIFGDYELVIENKRLYFRFKIHTRDMDMEREYIFDYN
jgi:hypothetical protein